MNYVYKILKTKREELLSETEGCRDFKQKRILVEQINEIDQVMRLLKNKRLQPGLKKTEMIQTMNYNYMKFSIPEIHFFAFCEGTLDLKV